MTDEAGIATFHHVPVGQYMIKVTGTTEFHDAEKAVVILNEEKIYELNQFIGIKPRIDLCAKFNFVVNENGRVEQSEQINFIDAKAILLPERDRPDADAEDFEFDVLYDNEKKLWTSTLISGTYMLVVKSKIYKEIA